MLAVPLKYIYYEGNIHFIQFLIPIYRTHPSTQKIKHMNTLSKCSKTRNNFFSAITTSRSFTTAGWLSSFKTAISLRITKLTRSTRTALVSPDCCGGHPFTFRFQMDSLQRHVLLCHFIHRLKDDLGMIQDQKSNRHLVHDAIRSLAKFPQFCVILHTFLK